MVSFMNNKFQNYSQLDRSVLMTEAGFAIVSAFDVKPTSKEAGLAESIFWNNFVNIAHITDPSIPSG